MIKNIILISLFYFHAVSGITPSDFLYVADINEALKKGDLARIEVSAQIVAQSLNYPLDIRILESDFNQGPFYMYRSSM